VSFLKIGSASPAGRDAVIREILNSAQQKSELEGSHTVLSPGVFDFWDSVTNFLMRLNATEGIDAMITCVQCSKCYSGIALDYMGEVSYNENGMAGKTVFARDYDKKR